MQTLRFKPMFDKLYFMLFIPLLILLIVITALSVIEPGSLYIIIPLDLFSLYFMVAPFFGYAALGENTLFIKYGFFIKREIAYEKIRDVKLTRGFLSYSTLSLKNSFEHIDIRYNAFDMTTISVRDNDGFIQELNARRFAAVNGKNIFTGTEKEKI